MALDTGEMTREQKIARLEKIRQVEALRAQANQQPGAAATGVDNGPTPAAEEGNPDSEFSPVKAIAKGLDYQRGAITAPLVGDVIHWVSGKPIYSEQELKDAMNPASVKTFPTTAEMLKRAGMKEGGHLSDVVPGYQEPSGNPWWYPGLPEKGGMLDPTLRGGLGTVIDMAVDPASYETFGVAAAKRAMGNTVAKAALEGNRGAKLLQKVGEVASHVPSPTELAMNIPGVKPAMSAVATPISSTLDWLGSKFYNTGIEPVERQGIKYGKKEIGDTMVNAGIMTPTNLVDKSQAAVQRLIDARNTLFQAGEAGGGRLSMDEAMSQARAKIAELRASKEPANQYLADQLEKKVEEHMAPTRPTPGTPGSPAVTEPHYTGLDESGWPQYEQKVVTPEVPPTPGQPGHQFSIQGGSNMKTSLYNETPDAAWNILSKTPEGASKVVRPLSEGLKTAVENATERGLKGGGAAVADVNDTMGKLLSTRQGQQTAAAQAERLTNSVVSPVTGTDKLAMSIAGAEGGPKAAGIALLLSKAANAARYGTMPVGYMMRKTAQSKIPGLTMDLLGKQALIQNQSPWAQPQE